MSAPAAKASFRISPFRVIAEGLNYPEGPVYRPDGTILVVEIGAGQLTRVHPGGEKEIVAKLGGGPNGAAIGPDGAVYICNDGGFVIVPFPQEDGKSVSVALGQPPDYQTGSIQRVAPDGAVTT